MTTRSKSPIEQAVHLAVWGPLGAALSVVDAVPEWADKARNRACEQFHAARALGELATEYGQKVVADALVGLGVLPGPPPPPRPPPGPTGEAVTVASGPSAPANGRTPAAPVREHADLAIPGYDTLSASQVVARLDGLAPAELEAVRGYEAASRGRRTILTRISQLQAERS